MNAKNIFAAVATVAALTAAFTNECTAAIAQGDFTKLNTLKQDFMSRKLEIESSDSAAVRPADAEVEPHASVKKEKPQAWAHVSQYSEKSLLVTGFDLPADCKENKGQVYIYLERYFVCRFKKHGVKVCSPAVNLKSGERGIIIPVTEREAAEKFVRRLNRKPRPAYVNPLEKRMSTEVTD